MESTGAQKTVGKEELTQAFEAYGKSRTKKMEELIAQSEFLFDGKTVNLQLVNQTLLDHYNLIKQEMLDFLRSHTGGSFEMVATVNAKVKEAKPRTEQEKFNAMLEKNPVLKDLKDDLGLDLIY